MAKSLVATSTKSESNLEVGLPRTVRQQPTRTFVFWRETFSSTFSSGAKMSRAFACANQRLMASPLRQTSHSAMHRGFLPPFFFCGCWCNFFHRPLYQPTSCGCQGSVFLQWTMYKLFLFSAHGTIFQFMSLHSIHFLTLSNLLILIFPLTVASFGLRPHFCFRWLVFTLLPPSFICFFIKENF